MRSAGEPEVALQGLEDIRAYIEILWRRRASLHVAVSRKQVRRYVRSPDFPASRLAGGQYVASPSEVEAWWDRVLRRAPAGRKGHEGREGQEDTKGRLG